MSSMYGLELLALMLAIRPAGITPSATAYALQLLVGELVAGLLGKRQDFLGALRAAGTLLLLGSQIFEVHGGSFLSGRCLRNPILT